MSSRVRLFQLVVAVLALCAFVAAPAQASRIDREEKADAHASAFKAAPAKYEPQYGGFCAMGVALDKKLDGDPTAWTIFDGKLFLNVNKDVQKKYLEDVAGNNRKADANWPQIRHKTPKSLG